VSGLGTPREPSEKQEHEFEGIVGQGLIMKTLSTLILAIGVAVPSVAQTRPEPSTFFKEYIGLKDDEIASIEGGKPVAKVLSTQMPSEVAVFGAIRISASPEEFLKAVETLDYLQNSPSYLAVRQISSPPKQSDFEGFVLEDQDIKDLQNCRPGKCQLQLPVESMEEFQNAVDWSAADASAQVNRLAQKMALQEMINYQQNGNSALGAYSDKDQPASVIRQFETLLRQSSPLSHYLPDLEQYLIGYPQVQLPDAQDVFYWEKVKFGLKPTLRMNHAIIYRVPKPSQQINAIAIKQLYASHYFQTALDVSVCAKDNTRQQDTGFYLITIKASRQAGLTGPKGSVIRKAAVSRTCSSLEKSLAHIKRILESGQGSAARGNQRLQMTRAGNLTTDH